MATFHVDYLTLTVFIPFGKSSREQTLTFSGIYSMFFEPAFGPLVDDGRTAFYKGKFKALAGVVVLIDPLEKSADRGDFCTIYLPGKALECIDYELIRAFTQFLFSNDIHLQCTRIDLAFDHAPFTVSAFAEFVWDHLEDKKRLRTQARREGFEYRERRAQQRENGETGTHGFIVGDRSSMRYLRVYDLHGFTRVELECKSERANLVFFDLLNGDFAKAMGHLVDYIDLDWSPWKQLKGSVERAGVTLIGARDVEAKRLVEWMKRQVAVALAVCEDLYPGFVNSLLSLGRENVEANQKYSVLFQKFREYEYE